MTDGKITANVRIEYLDLFRAFGILLMILGHIKYGDRFDYFIHAFHMPMFFFISGFLFRHRTHEELPFLSFLRKKARTLLVPYFVFGLINYLGWMILNRKVSLSPLRHLLFINNDKWPGTGALWFLTALFLADVIYFLIDRYMTNTAVRWCTVIVLSVFGMMAGKILPFTLPYALDSAMVGVGLFHLGYTIRRYEETRTVRFALHMPWWVWTICTILTVKLIFVNGYINMRTGEYAFLPLFWINVLLSVLVGLNFSQWLSGKISDTIICRWLTGIGRDSIVYVCLNQLVIKSVSKLCKLMPFLMAQSKWVVKSVVLILTLAVLWICSRILTKTNLRVLIGKKL